MSAPTISLCVITGQEEGMIERFLDSFKDAFDELCIVVAVGNQDPDLTRSKAMKWCNKNGKAFEEDQYYNEGWTLDNLGKPIVDDDPATWPHVDSFGNARNMAWQMGTEDFQLWADVDDVLEKGSAELIRKCSLREDVNMWCFTYEIRSNQEVNIRERLVRRGHAHWSQPLHETLRTNIPEKEEKLALERKVVFLHEPDSTKKRDPMRNLRIAAHSLRHIHAFAFELHREYFYKWQVEKTGELKEKATRWAEIAQVVDTLPEQRYQMFLHQAQILAETDLDHALALCWSAVQITPGRRDAWGLMAEFELKKGNGARALLAVKTMAAFVKPQAGGIPQSELFYGHRGLHLHTRCFRACGMETKALEYEDRFFKDNGSRFSLLHATRGRPEKALQTRANFFAAADTPLGIEHIFAIDEDDKESLEALKHYRHVVLPAPGNCVAAWNRAAEVAKGNILVQLSDDWIPSYSWDSHVWAAFEEGARIKKGSIEKTPLVLAVKDGLRTDDLLCIAILNQARYRQQRDGEGTPYMFSPEYKGVYSDNEFSVRAYKDRCVIKAKHIEFIHDHPLRNGVPVEEWDMTYTQQNSAERYQEGLATFQRRNP